MRDALPPPRPLPLPPPRAAGLALLASALAHAALLGGERAPPPDAKPARAASVALRMPPPTVPVTLPEPAITPVPPARSPRTDAPPPPVHAAQAPAEPAAPVEAPLLRLAGPAVWLYRLRQGGQDGEAQLDWQPTPDGRYSLRLTRRVGERVLPAQQSSGYTGGDGLLPERFALQRDGRDRQAVNFDAEAGRVSFSASPAQLALPQGTQDRLSWWLQLAALVQAADGRGGVPGGRWRVWVAGVRGELREWTFEVVAPDAQAPDEAGAQHLHLRRQPLGPHDPGIDIWMDPARGYWPVRLRQGDPETRGFEIHLADVNS